MKASAYRTGLALVTGSAVAWSLAGLFTRMIHLDTWTMLAWRGLTGAIGIALLIGIVRGREAWNDLHRLGWWGWSYAALGALCMVLFITALRHTTVAHVAVIYATVPFFAAVLGWVLLREAPSRTAMLASLVALAGVALMAGLSTEGGMLGDILALGMTAAMAFIMLIARHHRDMPVLTAACLSALLSGLVCWPLGHPLAITSSDLAVLALFGLVNSALGLALFTFGARLLPPVETALIGSLDAPLAPLWVWMAFQEVPSGTTIAGGAIVFVAVGVHLTMNALKPSAPSATALHEGPAVREPVPPEPIALG